MTCTQLRQALDTHTLMAAAALGTRRPRADCLLHKEEGVHQMKTLKEEEEQEVDWEEDWEYSGR
ncbi:hypothetical protein E2C01_045861 [Portunus trituberculatus]|uniref:Uncharacterized protein n=1 Tax=Portunus trituberculatus TaxID=210409 RepID=A0A5B7FZD7_PORTR|nr:hypothetical protein [Portunus trituberculatus]